MRAYGTYAACARQRRALIWSISATYWIINHIGNGYTAYYLFVRVNACSNSPPDGCRFNFNCTKRNRSTTKKKPFLEIRNETSFFFLLFRLFISFDRTTFDHIRSPSEYRFIGVNQHRARNPYTHKSQFAYKWNTRNARTHTKSGYVVANQMSN